MPRQSRPFSKQNAIKLDLVHRAQNDPLIHDENAPSMVLVERPDRHQPRRPTEDDYAYSAAGSVYSGASYTSYRSVKTKQRGDLEGEFGQDVRKNEGEAAQHGVFYDDTKYDYMQHMRDLGGMGSQWVEARQPDDKKKGKQKLEEMLADSLHLDDERGSVASSTTSSIARSLFPEEILPSEFVRKRTYQDQQDIPDAIAGFQPDMDPRLREVLEALEDEEYVDDDEDVFGELTRDGYEVEKDDWEEGSEQFFDEDDEAWQSDDTIKAPASPRAMPRELQLPEGVQLVEGESALPPEDPQAQPTADPAAGGWDFMKEHKAAAKAGKAEAPEPSFHNASLISSLASGRRKKRKGAKTSTTNYSMSSSALVRKDALRTLDERFDKMENDYSLAEFPEEEEDAYNADTQSMASGMTGMSSASRVSKAYSNVSGMSGMSKISSYSRANDEEAPTLVRSDMDSMMDEFLSSHNKAGKYGQRVRRGAPKTGMEQLDEIRSNLGPARFGSKTKPKNHVPVKIG
ncbi:putative Low temperature viability protein Ltv1 [Septoria linicola]|nr:putative Low temperature viability protein Ltv1 [Septoria linicola]